MRFQLSRTLAAATTACLFLTSTAAAAPETTPASAQACPTGPIVNLIAYEFPFCLAGKGLLENLFLSRPADTKLSASPNPSSSSSSTSYGSGCADVNATKGVAHSYFYTADGGDLDVCQLVTYDRKGCEGEGTTHELGVGFSECFSKASRFVKPIVASAEIVCERS